MLNNLFVILTALMALRAEDTKVTEDTEVVEDEREGRIINGREARPFSYPFIVSLQRNGRHFCGGSLLDSTTVLTAAHCTDVVPTNEITVNVRRHDLRLQSSQEGGQSIRITRQTRHPQYNPQTILNDVAVWKLATPVSVQASYVTLDNGQFASQVNLPAETIGWGRINPHNNIPATRLQQTVLPIYDHQQCSRGYGNSLSPQAHVCAGYAEGISASCEGDSGGPLFVNQGGRTIQIGITSFGRNKQCLNPGIPTVFARVANYVPWIQSQQRRN